MSKKKKYILLTCITAIALTMLAAFDVRLKVVHYTLKTTKLDKNLRLALVTDLHSCRYGKEQRTLVDALNNERPDIVLLGGDIFDDKISDDNTKTFLKAIAKRYPCYYVTGNHEYWSRRSDEMLKWLEENGIVDIGAKTIDLNLAGSKISLSGINDQDKPLYTGKGIGMHQELELIGKSKNDEDFTILLAHRPAFIKSYLEYGFDLVLSGHAHGGQWRIPYILNGTFAPDEGFFPKYAGGYYHFEKGDMIVSRGLARESTRVPRIFNRPELVIVDLEAMNSMRKK